MTEGLRLSMEDSARLQEFLKEYEKYHNDVLKPTFNEIQSTFGPWKSDPNYWASYTPKSWLPAPSPIHRVRPNIKRPESVVDKILRKPADFPNGLAPESFALMNDCVRLRVIVYFLAQLGYVDCEIRRLHKEGNLEISPTNPPVAFLDEELTKRFALSELRRVAKDSGYISLHYILRFRSTGLPEDQRPWFELQVRTLAEDVWGEIEHILGYKPQKKTSFAVKKQFWILSKQLSAIDEHFNFLYEELSRFQEEASIKDSDPLNAENLPSVVSDIGVGCAQQEVHGLLKLLHSRGISKVGNLREVAIPRRVETIRHLHLSLTQRAANNFEIIATLATLRHAKTPEEEHDLIKAQIAYLDAWDTLKRTSGR
jgi:putative GTP pyrophosphokinase